MGEIEIFPDVGGCITVVFVQEPVYKGIAVQVGIPEQFGYVILFQFGKVRP